MSDRDLLKEIDKDLQIAPGGVIYLEGKTDVSVLFGYLGTSRPIGDVHNGTLVRGLVAGDGSGSTAVEGRVRVAIEHKRSRVFGIVDGDGRELPNTFDAPYAGPLFTWKVYSIENLLPKAGWPKTWGDEPSWHDVYRGYAPYVALNGLIREMQSRTRALGIARLQSPDVSQPLKTRDDVVAALNDGRTLITDFDVALEFDRIHEAFVARIADDAEVHRHLNGKWFWSHLAVDRVKKTGRPNVTAEECLEEWSGHAAAAGGVPEVREWWTRVTGREP